MDVDYPTIMELDNRLLDLLRYLVLTYDSEQVILANASIDPRG